MFGRGLHGFRIRFALMMAVFVIVLGILEQYNDVWFPEDVGQIFVHSFILLVGVAAIAMIYAMTGRLTRPIEILKAGADAVSKGRHMPALPNGVPTEIKDLSDSVRAMIDLIHANAVRMGTLAFVDAVTGLPNRAALSAMMSQIDGRSGAVFLLNLDRFKPVNDIFGHDLGDSLLAHVGQRIGAKVSASALFGIAENLTLAGTIKMVPPQDAMSLFRFSGDEFVLLVLDDVSRGRLDDLAAEIVRCLSEPFDIDGYHVTIGVSVGICRFPTDSDDMTEALSYADLALDAAKANGGGKASFFTSAMQQMANDRAELEADLVLAFKRDELVLYYQPKVNMIDRKMIAVEALVRWQHPARGLLFPDRFLPIVEKTGRMAELGRVVCRKALEDAKRWHQAGLDLAVAVNVCPTELGNPEFAAQILGIVEDVGIDARFLELELTESVAIQEPHRISAQLEVLRKAGILISVDDFGTGYSNIAELCQMSFDTLKLDRSLIIGIGRDNRADSIVKSLVLMSHSLGLKVVAEGVETEEQWSYLHRCGCEQVQGYLVGRPMPATDILNWSGLPSRAVA